MKKRIIITYLINILLIFLSLIFILGVSLGYYSNRTIDSNLHLLMDTVTVENDNKISNKSLEEHLKDYSFYLLSNDFKVLDSLNNNNISFEKNILNKSILEENQVITLNKESNSFKKIIARKINDNILVITYNRSVFFEIFKYFNEYVIFIILILFLVSVIFAIYFVNQIIQPINDLEIATDKIAKGDISYRIKSSDISSLKPLANNFNILTERLETTIIDTIEKQNQLDSILSSMNSGVIAINNDDKILIFNTFAKSLFGTFKDYIGQDIYQVLTGYDVDEMLDVNQNGSEIQIKRNETRTIRYRTSYLKGVKKENVGKVIVLEDITDIKKLESLRSQFVANVSHELKTPLTSIKGYSETLRDVSDEKIRNKFLDIIDAESDRLTRLIEDILSLSAIENSEVYFDIVDAASASYEACQLLVNQAKDKMVEFTLTTKGRALFIGDKDRYLQMIINLVDNAIKYTNNGGKVKVRVEGLEDKINITVHDNGVGIPKEHLPRLFERFYRVSKSRDRAKGGTGLGLAIVKHIVLSFNGTIEVFSDLGKGTTFLATLPRYIDVENNDSNEINTYKLN